MDCGLDYSKAEGLFNKSAGTVGSKFRKDRGSFERIAAKGYHAISTVGLNLSGRD